MCASDSNSALLLFVTHTHTLHLSPLPTLLSPIDQMFCSFILHHKQIPHWPPSLPPTTIDGALPSHLCSSSTFGETFLPSGLHKPSSPIVPSASSSLSLPFFQLNFIFLKTRPKGKKKVTNSKHLSLSLSVCVSVCLSVSPVPADQHLQFPRKQFWLLCLPTQFPLPPRCL